MIRVFIRQIQRSDHVQEQGRVTLTEQRACADALLRRVLREYYGESAVGLAIARGENGKPYFPGAPEICYNISHAGDYAVLAIGEEPVGVDIEKIRPIHPRVAERYLGNAHLTGREAILAWTKRESYGKFTGEGVFAKDYTLPHVFTELAAPEGYVICVCTASGEVAAAESDFTELDKKNEGS